MTNIQFQSGAIEAGDCVSNGWNLVKPNYWMYFGIAVVAVILMACVPCISLFLVGPVGVGVYYVLLREMRGEPVEFGMMFHGFNKFVSAMVVGLIQSIPGIIWTIFDYSVNIASFLADKRNRDLLDFYQAGSGNEIFAGLTALYVVALSIFLVVSLVWGLTFMFALPLLAEHDLGAIDALKLSARAAWGNVGGLILLFIFEMLIVLIGVLALCIGVFFVLPILYATIAFAYRQVFPLIERPFNMTPPPPTAYGFGAQG